MEGKKNEYSSMSTQELLKLEEKNNDIILKENKIYRPMDIATYVLGGGCVISFCTFVIASQPILKMFGFLMSTLTAGAGIAIMGSHKYIKAKHEIEVASNSNKLIKEELEQRENEE